MGGYDDYSMVAGGEPVAGICHARGGNADLPPVWLPYFEVASLDESLAAVQALGGEVLVQPRAAGAGVRYAVVRDPGGAAAALAETVQSA